MLNKTRLRAIRKMMLANADHFQYRYLFSNKDFLGIPVSLNGVSFTPYVSDKSHDFIEHCGTCCCIAGFTIKHMMETKYEDFPDFVNANTSSKYLGLTIEEQYFLFTPLLNEEKDFRVRLHWTTNCEQKERAETIKHLLTYPHLGTFKFTEAVPIEKAIARIDHLLTKPEPA